MSWFHCNAVFYIGLSIFMCVSSTVFEKINFFLVNNVWGQVSVIAYNLLFLKN